MLAARSCDVPVKQRTFRDDGDACPETVCCDLRRKRACGAALGACWRRRRAGAERPHSHGQEEGQARWQHDAVYVKTGQRGS
jgi:hypothetical protein